MPRPDRPFRRFIAPALVAFLAGACGAPAQVASQAPGAIAADSTFKGFHKIGDYMVAIDGAEVPAAEVYQLDNPFAFLILADKLPSPALVSVREKTIESVPVLKVSKRGDGQIDLLADTVFTKEGRLEVSAKGEASFTMAGHRVELRDRPPLIGLKSASDLITYNAEYGRLAKAYTPSDPIVQRLKTQPTPILVTVYFGSWCPHCKEMVPRVMKVAEQLAGSKIQFAYYGLPKDIVSDPKAKELGLNSVPTGVVTLAGKEVGRISGNSFKIPELAISNALLEVNGAAGKGR